MAQACWKCGASSTPTPVPPIPEPAFDHTHLLTRNDVPHESEIPFIRDIITDDQNRVDALDIEIRHLEATLAKLVRQRDENAEHLRQHRAILHPIRRVPPELICEIFALTLAMDHVSGNNGEIANKPPWHLGHICQSWRFYGLAYPQLWNSITIPSSPIQDGYSMLETQLLRSANAPLRIHWAEDENGLNGDPQLADLVIAQCGRWTNLCLNTRFSANALNWLLPVKGRLSSLEKLELIDGVGIPDLFLVAPSLRQFISTSWDMAYYSPDIRVPWDQITHYRGAFREIAQLDILRAATNLLQCAISFEDINRAVFPNDNPSPVELRHLRRLCIEKPRYLVHITLPSLQELYCMCLHDRDTLAFRSFAQRSSCLLRKLVLTSCDITSKLITVLGYFPSLAYLLIEASITHRSEEMELEQTFFAAMAISGTSRDLCPNLTSFVYGIRKEAAYDAFFAMVESRFRPSDSYSGLAQLRVFDPFDSDHSAFEDVAMRIDRLRDQGFDAAFLDMDEANTLTAKGFFS